MGKTEQPQEEANRSVRILTFVAEAEQVDEGAVGGAQRWLILLRGQGLEVGQVGGAGGPREDRRVRGPVGGGRGRGRLVIGSHVAAANPDGRAKDT